MPKWGLTMEEGTLVTWMVEVGDAIEPGMELAEVETDKIVNVMEATFSGVLLKKVADEGDVLPVSALLGVVGDSSASEAEIDDFIANFGSEVPTETKEADAPVAAAPGGIYEITMPKWGLTMEEGTLVKWMVEVGTTVEPGMELAEVETDKIVNVLENTHSGVVSRIVAEEGDVLPVGALLGIIAAEGISDADIDAYLDGGGAAATEESTCSAPAEESVVEPVAPAEELVPVAGMRAAIAKTVSTSWSNIPHYMVTVAINMGKADALARSMKEAGTKVSINDLIIKASAVAIQKYPLMNASYADKNITLHRDVNMAVAIGLDEGVVMPVIRNCQSLSLPEIGVKSRELVALAKDGKLGKAEMSDGTIAISNMGMLGVESFVAIVPPTMSAILAIGTVKDEAVVREGKIEVAKMMRITISADHRVHDGAYAAKFLAELRGLLEAPEILSA
ncbi:MAG: 2-oxo acid dehydrogenase subunit E2 [Deltaproteobacteria bacterium]|nr:2-oxo acid dehydrogenase subunit E2 [Deltaproteobacteria bacterium]TLN04691.1 MAG: 2-oxo acid dehydrogenase subunit E2 [bacterium]